MFTIKSVHSRAVTTTLVALSNVHTNNDDLYAILSTVQKSTSWWRQFQEEAHKPKDDQADSEALEDEKPSDEQAASTSTSDKTATEAGADAEADQPAEAKSNAAAEASGSTSAADAAESTETIKEEPDDGAAESSSSSDTNNNNTSSSSSSKQKKDKKNKKKGKKDSAKSSKADDDEAELEDDDSVVQSSDAAISDAALEKDDNIALLEQLPTMVSGHNRKIDMGIMNNVFMQLRKVANHSLLNRSIYQEEYVSSGTTVVPSHSIIDILVIPVFLPRLQSMSPTPASSKAMTNRRLLRN